LFHRACLLVYEMPLPPRASVETTPQDDPEAGGEIQTLREPSAQNEEKHEDA
jgi:hypothetical protein